MAQSSQQSPNDSPAWTIIGVLLFLMIGSLVWLTSPQTPIQLGGYLAANYCVGWAIIAFFSRRPIDELRKQFVMVTVSFALIVALFEAPALAGLIDYRSFFRIAPLYEPTHNPDYELDDELLYKRRPYRRY